MTVTQGRFKGFCSITAKEHLAKGATPGDVIKVLSLSLATVAVVALGQELSSFDLLEALRVKPPAVSYWFFCVCAHGWLYTKNKMISLLKVL